MNILLMINLQGDKNDNNTADNSGFWRKIWNLKIPPKIKSFSWRASTNCLPTRDTLLTKRVPVIITCPVCNDYPESCLHIFTQCAYVESVWGKLDISFDMDNINYFSEWLDWVFQHYNKEKVLDIVMGVQDRTFDRSLGYISAEDGDEHWTLPPANSVKINTDVAIFEENSNFSFAFVVRDHRGSLIEVRTRCLRGSPNPDLAEALGIREALSWIKNEDQHDVILESDCLQNVQVQNVQAIRSSFTCLSYLGRVIKDCRELLVSLSEKNVKFKFVKRSVNKVAHFLARQNCSLADRIWRMGDVHSDFQYVLSNDLIIQ
ncbi:uncharacterized protein LOC141679422 [Apium graveolens]|uniref:uncharacterized protein LOC141679422 n=1 Tax=Apium graveolens TaxID=4045 RepID=UPI003D797E46